MIRPDGRLARLVRSVACASVAGLGASFLDARWAASAAGAGLGGVFAGDAGLIAPLAAAAGVAAGVCALVIDPDSAPTPRSLVARLRLRAVGRPAEVAAFAPLAVLGAFFWVTLTAHAARALLAIDAAPALVGVGIAAAAMGLGVYAALAVLAALPPLRRALATASEGRPACVDPVVTSAFAFAAALALAVFGVATGTVSGDGGVFGVYGILKRPELDLRAPVLIGAVFVAGLFGPAVTSRLPALMPFVIALVPAAFTVRAATALAADPEATAAIERGAPVGRLALGPLRRLGDRDHDGASRWFGGGDCDDSRPDIFPGAAEIADNGVDEDCSGADLTGAALARVAARPASTAPASKPLLRTDLNLILITVDTLRADLGFAGNPRALSPNLDALARRSTVFERAYSLASYTGKSVGPLLIGKYASETHRNWGHFNRFGEQNLFVAQRLQKAGVRTMSVQGHRYFGAFGGLDRGFDVVDLSAAPAEGTKWDTDDRATSHMLSDAALALLARPDNRDRFFLWIHYLDPHADYLPHDDVPRFGTSQRDLYDGEVAFTDKQIGRVLEYAAGQPWGERTAVIVTSDHGEAFGEHKMWRHGFELWEPLVRVPLIVHVPGMPPGRVPVRRGAIDVVPTILELLGAPAPADGSPTDFLSGQSLAPDLSLPDGASAAPRPVLIDMPAGPYNDARRAVVDGDDKLVVSNDSRFELYDLAADPGEANDLWAKPHGQAARARMAALYAAIKARMREIRVTGPRR